MTHPRRRRSALELEPLENLLLPTFLAPVPYGVGEYVLAVVAADFNKDGVLDLATANNDSNTLSVLLGNRNGSFRPATHYAAGARPFGLAAALFHDAKEANPTTLALPRDLVTANSTSVGTVSVLRGLGDGTFAARVAHSAGTQIAPVGVAAADLNVDGHMDVVTANRVGSNQASVSVLLGVGDGSFRPPVLYALGALGWGGAVAVGDVNGDGRTDVVALALRGLGVLLGNGDGTLQALATVPLAPSTSLDLADLNGDTVLDLVIGGNELEVRRGNGDGTFGPALRLLDQGISDVAVADFDRDGRPDVAATHFPEALTVFRGNGDGTFRAGLPNSPGPDDGPLAAGDFDGDGWTDLAVGNQEAASVSVLLNDRQWPAGPGPGSGPSGNGGLGSEVASALTSLPGRPAQQIAGADGRLPATLAPVRHPEEVVLRPEKAEDGLGEQAEVLRLALTQGERTPSAKGARAPQWVVDQIGLA